MAYGGGGTPYWRQDATKSSVSHAPDASLQLDATSGTGVNGARWTTLSLQGLVLQATQSRMEAPKKAAMLHSTFYTYQGTCSARV